MKKAVCNIVNPFVRMSPAQKRVAIAKDVIAQIKVKKFAMTSGTFAVIRNECGERMYYDADFYLLNSKAVHHCDVCAVGAAIVSGIRLFNVAELDSGEVRSREAMDLAKNYFSEEQVRLIENAFETGDGAWEEDETDCEPQFERAIKFGRRYDSPEKRAVAIFSNIIRNNGEFKP